MFFGRLLSTCVLALLIFALPSHGQVQASNQYREGRDKIKILSETDTSKVYTSLTQEHVDETERIVGRSSDTSMTNVIPKNEEFISSVTETDSFEYVSIDPDGYSVSLILDPCRGYSTNCCNNSYGSGEYFRNEDVSESSQSQYDTPQTNMVCPGLEPDCLLRANGDSVDTSETRLATFDVKFDSSCENEFGEGPGQETTCISEKYRKVASPLLPPCWDRNDTLDATSVCVSEDGSTMRKNCISVGYSSTAYIMDCMRAFDDEDCGVFIEIHKPRDARVISEQKVPGGFVSGYRTMNISSLFQGQSNEIMCDGDYEMWWVQRVPHSTVRYIEYIKPFRVAQPACKYDGDNSKYFDYAILDEVIAAQEADHNAGWFEFIIIDGSSDNEGSSQSYEEVIDQDNVFRDENGQEHVGRSIFFSMHTGETSYDLPQGARHRTENEWFVYDVDESYEWQTSFARYEGNRRTGSIRLVQGQ